MRNLSFSTLIGLLVIVGYIVVDRYVASIPDLIAIPVMLVGIALVLIGTVRGSGRQPRNKG